MGEIRDLEPQVLLSARDLLPAPSLPQEGLTEAGSGAESRILAEGMLGLVGASCKMSDECGPSHKPHQHHSCQKQSCFPPSTPHLCPHSCPQQLATRPAPPWSCDTKSSPMGSGDSNAAATVPTSAVQGSMVRTWEPTAVLASLHAAHRAAPHFRAATAAPAPTGDFPTALFLLKGFGLLQHLGRNPAPGAQDHPQNRGNTGAPGRLQEGKHSFLEPVEGLGTETSLSSMWVRTWGPSELV